jgi:hypothetical protein
VPTHPDICCCSSALLVLKPSEITRNSARVLTTWICLMKMAEFSTALQGILLFNGNQAAVRIILLIAKAIWDH